MSALFHTTHVHAHMRARDHGFKQVQTRLRTRLKQVGGLGDVVTGLARVCLARGHDVCVLLPFYECLPKVRTLRFPTGFGLVRHKWHLYA